MREQRIRTKWDEQRIRTKWDDGADDDGLCATETGGITAFFHPSGDIHSWIHDVKDVKLSRWRKSKIDGVNRVRYLTISTDCKLRGKQVFNMTIFDDEPYNED